MAKTIMAIGHLGSIDPDNPTFLSSLCNSSGYVVIETNKTDHESTGISYTINCPLCLNSEYDAITPDLASDFLWVTHISRDVILSASSPTIAPSYSSNAIRAPPLAS